MVVEEVEGELVQGQLTLRGEWNEVWFEDDPRPLDPGTSHGATEAFLPRKFSWLSLFSDSIFSGPIRHFGKGEM